MRRAVAAFALGGLLLGGSVFATEEETQNAITRGSEYVAQKDYKKALKEYESALRSDPKNSKAALLLGLTHATAGDLNKALEYVERSVSIEPSYSAYHNLGLIHANRADYEKATASYEKAVALNPEAYRTWYQMGLTCAASGDFSKAIENYRKALELNPRLSEALLGLASASYWSGDKTGAREQVERLRTIGDTVKANALLKWIEKRESQRPEDKQETGSAA